MEGGVGAFTQVLAQTLANQQAEVHIITSRQARPEPKPTTWQGLLEPVDLGYATQYPIIHKWKWPSLAQVTDTVIHYGLDVVNIQYQAAAYDMNSPAINFLPWRLKGVCRTAVTFHDLRTPYLFPKAGRLRQTAVHFMARQAHGVIVTNPQDAQALHPHIVPQRLRQIPIGSNITAHHPSPATIAALRQNLGLTVQDHLLGYFGFLHESKGADLLVSALAHAPANVHLLFIGGQTGSSDPQNTAPFLQQIQQQITDLGLSQRVHWTGFVPESEVSAYLDAVDLMVLPYRDGVSLRRGTLMAVLAHGRPLLTTEPALPTPELMHGQNIYLVPANDLVTLATAITHLLAHPAQRAQLGHGAAQVAGLFAWDKIAAQTLAFLSELTATK